MLARLTGAPDKGMHPTGDALTAAPKPFISRH